MFVPVVIARSRKMHPYTRCQCLRDTTSSLTAQARIVCAGGVVEERSKANGRVKVAFGVVLERKVPVAVLLSPVVLLLER